MLLFVGLGNPGDKFKAHRHNVGFMAVDEIVRRHNFLPEKSRWQALTHEGRLGTEKVIVVKPQTFMNLSGQAVGEAMRFFKLAPEEVFVFYDELDLAFGKVKVKKGGGAAGHNGIRSITDHIGPEFHRIRIGIGHPGDKARVHGHVLGDFAKAEKPELEKILDALSAAAPHLIREGAPRYTTEVARLINPPRPSTGKARPEAAKEQSATATREARSAHKTETKDNKSNEGPMAQMLRALKLKGDK